MEQAAQRCCWRTVWDFSFLADWKTTSRPPWDIVLSIWEIFEHSPWRVQCYSSGFFVSEAWKSCFGASSRKIWKNKFEWAIDKPYLLLYILVSHTVQSFILPLFVVIICKFCFFSSCSSFRWPLCVSIGLDCFPPTPSSACWKGKGKDLFMSIDPAVNTSWKRATLNQVVKAYLVIYNPSLHVDKGLLQPSLFFFFFSWDLCLLRQSRFWNPLRENFLLSRFLKSNAYHFCQSRNCFHFYFTSLNKPNSLGLRRWTIHQKNTPWSLFLQHIYLRTSCLTFASNEIETQLLGIPPFFERFRHYSSGYQMWIGAIKMSGK